MHGLAVENAISWLQIYHVGVVARRSGSRCFVVSLAGFQTTNLRISPAHSMGLRPAQPTQFCDLEYWHTSH